VRRIKSNNLFKEVFFEENYGAYQFLINRSSTLESVTNPTKTLQQIELVIKKFKKNYPHQMETAKKLFHSYKKILEAIKN